MKHIRLFIILLITLAAGLLSVSADSLWMDEGKRMVHACYGTWEMLWRGMELDMQPLFSCRNGCGATPSALRTTSCAA